MTEILYLVLGFSTSICYFVSALYVAHRMEPGIYPYPFGFTEGFSITAPFLIFFLTALSPSVVLLFYFDLVNLFAESIFDPCVSGDIEEVPVGGSPLSPLIEEPSVPLSDNEQLFQSCANGLVIVVLVIHLYYQNS